MHYVFVGGRHEKAFNSYIGDNGFMGRMLSVIFF